jgi:hypothetical protein
LLEQLQMGLSDVCDDEAFLSVHVKVGCVVYGCLENSAPERIIDMSEKERNDGMLRPEDMTTYGTEIARHARPA